MGNILSFLGEIVKKFLINVNVPTTH